MSSTTEAQGSSLDTAKLLVSVLVLGGAVGGFYYFAEASTLVRVLGLLAAVGVAFAIFLQTEVGRNTWRFLGDARTEVRKVVWPTRAETIQTTLMVAVMVVVVAIFLWLLDMFLMWGVQALTGQGG
ncbi:preprotein translocase subunit SecE [Endothiovibrio diazotrophicus]